MGLSNLIVPTWNQWWVSWVSTTRRALAVSTAVYKVLYVEKNNDTVIKV